MKTGLLLFAAASALTAAAPAMAQESKGTWTVNGSVRLRYEGVDNEVRPGFNASDELVTTRARLFAEYKQGPVRFGAQIDDSRAFNGDRHTAVSSGDVNTLEVVQAYAAADLQAGALGKVSVQGGRFLLNLGSTRLIASDDYRNATNSYTGLRVDMAPAGLKVNLVYAQPRIRLPDDIASVLDNRSHDDLDSRNLELWSAFVAKPKAIGGATLEGSFVRLNEHDAPGRPTRDRRLNSFGARIVRDAAVGRWNYEVEAIGQTGHVSSGLGAADPTLDVKAGFLHAAAGYTFNQPLRPHLSLEWDVATGDKPGGHYGRFDTLFGSRRTDLAPSGLYNAVARTNLNAPGVRLELTPPKARWDAMATYKLLWLEADTDTFSGTGVRDATGRAGSFAGRQLDGRVRYWLIKDRLRSELDAVWLDKASFLKNAPNATHAGDETYVSMNLTAQF